MRTALLADLAERTAGLRDDGLFKTERVIASPQTAHITLYQNNLERFARTRQELLDEIRITVLHEVGHLLGLDEDELYERGLD